MKETLKPNVVDTSMAVNAKDPVRLAFLGGPKTGKSSFIQKLAYGKHTETYYPLRKTAPYLCVFSPSTELLKVVLNTVEPKAALEGTLTKENVVMSPVLYDALAKAANEPVHDGKRNDIYACDKKEQLEISPIYTELIDTPAFNVNLFVPFLEASLYARLGKDVLKNLADLPRQPVSTEPLLVASGAAEMNGAIDGYFLFYSAIPSAQPPSYDLAPPDISPSSSIESCESYNDDGTLKSVTFKNMAADTTFALLPNMKVGLEQAWKEYYTYKTRWDQGKEKDMFSLKSALRGIFEKSNAGKIDAPSGELLETSHNPADPLCPPPVWIVCTHTDLHLASPKLISDGKRLAKIWGCGFVAVDVGQDTTQILALMVREISERRRLQKRRRRS